MNLQHLRSTTNPLEVVPPEARFDSIGITEDPDLAQFVEETDPAATVVPVLLKESLAQGSGHVFVGSICFVVYEVDDGVHHRTPT